MVFTAPGHKGTVLTWYTFLTRAQHSLVHFHRSLAAGKHVLVEKPFTANEEEARDVHKMARRRGLLCREAFHYRHHPLHERLIHIVKASSQNTSVGDRYGPRSPQGRLQCDTSSMLGRVQRIDVKLLIPR